MDLKVSHGEHGDGGSGKGGEGHSDGHVLVVFIIVLLIIVLLSIVLLSIVIDDFFFDLDTGGPGPGFEGCSGNDGGLSSDVSIGGSSLAEKTTSDLCWIGDDLDRAAPVVSGGGLYIGTNDSFTVGLACCSVGSSSLTGKISLGPSCFTWINALVSSLSSGGGEEHGDNERLHL